MAAQSQVQSALGPDSRPRQKGLRQPQKDCQGLAALVSILLNVAQQNERILFHYNGHGVPKPTGNGEIWVFNAHYTQYIPLSVYDLQCWMGNPVIYVLDSPSAGTIIDSVSMFMEQAKRESVLLHLLRASTYHLRVCRLA